MKRFGVLSLIMATMAISGGCVTVQAHKAVIEQRNALQKAVQAMETRLAEGQYDEQQRIVTLERTIADLTRRNTALETTNRHVLQQRDELNAALAAAKENILQLQASPPPAETLVKQLDEARTELQAMTQRCRDLELLVAELTEDPEPERTK